MDGYAVSSADVRPAPSCGRRRCCRGPLPAHGGGRDRGPDLHRRGDPSRRGLDAARPRTPRMRRCCDRHRSRALRACTSAAAARTCTRATCSPGRGNVLTFRLVSAGLGRRGLLAVHRRPPVGLLVTGNELLPAGAPPEPGDLRVQRAQSIGLLAGPQVKLSSAIRPVADDFAATRAAVVRGLHADCSIVSGGVSVGPHDHVGRRSGLRRRRSLLARTDQARQASLVRPPRPARSSSAFRATRCRRSSASRFSSPRAAPPGRGGDEGPTLVRGRLAEPAGPPTVARPS